MVMIVTLKLESIFGSLDEDSEDWFRMPKESGVKYPRVVEIVGKNPEQYPDYE